MNRIASLRSFSVVVSVCLLACLMSSPILGQVSHQGKLPNVLLILADDLGYGDVSCYNGDSKIRTPNIDQLANEGLRFTDAHSPSTVCTPTRYSLMTGRMAFRNGMRGVFDGVGGPCLIRPEQLTMAEMFRRQGYFTACVGKWHIGLTFYDQNGDPIQRNGLKAVQEVDFNRPISDGPLTHGFDEFFGTACCPTTDWLYAWIEGDRVPNPPVRLLDKSKVPQHPYSKDNRRGLIADDFELENVDLTFLERSQQIMRRHVSENPDQPFFLFHSAQAVHLPSLAADQFKGKSAAGPHGDFIFELDHVVGELLKTLKEIGVEDETMVIFTSDNGPEVPTVIAMRRDHQHDGAKPWRGMKRDNWEGGHRVPTLVKLPGVISSGRVSAQTFCLTDIMATCASMIDFELPVNSAEDSYDFWPVLTGKQSESEMVREYTLHQTIKLELAIRKGNWKYLDHRGSGGNSYQKGRLAPFAIDDGSGGAEGQLYDLENDPGETRNLFYKHPEIVKELKEKLESFKKSGRSR